MTIDRQGPSRVIIDSSGTEWRLREMMMAEGLGGPTRRSLIALNQMVIRRFWIFPEAWFELPEPALVKLIEGPAQMHPEARSQREQFGG